MYGAILGDIIGSATEFRPIKTKQFELFRPNCQFTDDTVMTIATADALLNDRPFSIAYHEWGNRYPDMGCGPMFRDWMSQKDPKPYGSYGNGSAMRVSPIGWCGLDMEGVATMAELSAEPTHNSVDGRRGAIAVATAIYLARNHASKNHIKELIESTCWYDLHRSLELIRPTYRFHATCQKSVPEAIICFLESTSTEDAIRNAVSLGGDADTQAAIAGSIAEAYYGIPMDLKAKVREYLPEDMLLVIDQFEEEFES